MEHPVPDVVEAFLISFGIDSDPSFVVPAFPTTSGVHSPLPVAEEWGWLIEVEEVETFCGEGPGLYLDATGWAPAEAGLTGEGLREEVVDVGAVAGVAAGIVLGVAVAGVEA